MPGLAVVLAIALWAARAAALETASPAAPAPQERPSVSTSKVFAEFPLRRADSTRVMTAADSARARAASLPHAPALPKQTGSPNARLYLSWHAPYGQPGASELLNVACGDTSIKDTLYLTFEPGRGTDHFLGITATVYFWAGLGDSLGPQWQFGGGEKFHGLEVEFNPKDVAGAPRACPDDNIARAGYSFTRASGKLRMILAVPQSQALAVEATTRYVLARLLVPRPAANMPGCGRPMCIEWAEAGLAYGYGDSPVVNRGSRFVAWNSPDGSVCGPMRRFATSAPWTPPIPAASSKKKP